MLINQFRCLIVLILYLKLSLSYKNYILNSNFETSKIYDFIGKIDTFDILPNKKTPIQLDNFGHNSAAIIQQVWNTSTIRGANENFDIKIEALNKNANKNTASSGIYAVIQRLKLRKSSRTLKCIDYVKFRFGNKRYSDEICTNIGPGFDQVLTLEDVNGEFKMYVHIETKLPLAYKETLELMVVFTAYSDCHNSNDSDSDDDSSSSEDKSDVVSNKQIRCSSKNKFNSCISKVFENDNIINCPEPNCEDEGGCPNFSFEITSISKPSTSNIALSAITSLIFTMAAVGTCLWVCFKYRECVSICAADTARQQQRRRRSPRQNSNLQSTGVDFSASAPPYPDNEKDLPPSYDELFGGNLTHPGSTNQNSNLPATS